MKNNNTLISHREQTGVTTNLSMEMANNRELVQIRYNDVKMT